MKPSNSIWSFGLAAMGLVSMAPAALAENTSAASQPQNCAAVTERDVTGLFDRWNASLATKDPAKVTENYAADAVLLPTVSNKPRTNAAEIKEYFIEFLKKEPQGTIDTRKVRIGCNTASDVGTYTFKLKGDNGAVQTVAARYSYIYELRDGAWKIVHHHSSAMPEKVN